MLLTVLLVVGGLNYIFMALNNDLFKLLGPWKRWGYGILGIATLLVLRTELFLPFLAESAFPTGLLQEMYPKNSDINVKLQNLPPNRTVIYWGAEQDATNPKAAYSEYSNSGVTKTDESGSAELLLRCPGKYAVRGGFQLPKHIHYRYSLGNGMLSKVYTVKMDC
jgi:hypothetical protein